MRPRFERIGLDFRFNPSEVPVSLYFYRVKDEREFTARVDVFNGEGRRFITRPLNLLASPTARGSVKDLIEELHSSFAHPSWAALLREACQSVIASSQAGRAVDVIEGAIERPPPPSWLSHGLLLKNKPNVWIGAASTGKSTLGKACCAYYASGYRFCDRPMEQGVPLYLDWEDDRQDFERVVHDVCRNLGVWPLPRMLWRDMHGYRLRDQLTSLAQLIDREHVGLVVLDAIAAAGGAPGEHAGYESIALELEHCLGVLPPVTVLGLDHVTSAEHKIKGYVPLKARGAERKVEFFRNQWSLVTDDRAAQVGRHVVEWHHTKVNVIAKEPPFATEILHREAEISIMVRPLETTPTEDGAQSDKVLAKLAEASPQTAREVAWRLDGRPPDPKREDTIRRTLDRWCERGQAQKTGKRPTRYWVVDPDNVSGTGIVLPFPGATS